MRSVVSEPDTAEAPEVSQDELRLAELERHIQIDPDSLAEEIISYTSHFYHIGLGHARAISLRDMAKEDVSALEAELFLRYRQDAIANNEKATEAILEAKVNSDPDRLDAIDKYIRSRLAADRWNNLRETFVQKGHMLRQLGELHKINYFGERPVSATERDDAGARVRNRATS
jgi:hypothetical protein